LAVQGHQFILDSTGNDTFGLHVTSTQTSQSFGYSVSKVTGQGQAIVSGLTGHDILVYDATVENVGSVVTVGNGTIYGENVGIRITNHSLKDSSYQLGIEGSVFGDHGNGVGGKTGTIFNVFGNCYTTVGHDVTVFGGTISNDAFSARINGTTGDSNGIKVSNSNTNSLGSDTQTGGSFIVNGTASPSTSVKYGLNVSVSNDALENYGVRVSSAGATTNYAIFTDEGTSIFNNNQNTASHFQIKGGSVSGLFYADASIDNVGIGTTLPVRRLHVSGDYSFYHDPTTEITTSVSGYGDIVTFGTGSLTAGNLYYYNSSGAWVATDANAASGATGLLAFALANEPSKGMLIRGYIRNSGDAGFSTTTGDILYVSTTTGGITTTAPSGTGDIIRIIGYSLDGTTETIYFNPDNTWVEI
jgi:hypothetical protein